MPEFKHENIRFVPTNCYAPNHYFVKSCVFPYDKEENPEIAAKDANLADAIAQVGEQNGLTMNDVTHLLPFIFRMLKSNSPWTR